VPASAGLPVAAQCSHQDFEERLEIVLKPSQADDLKPEFAAYTRALDSTDWAKRQEPTNVIAYLAPTFMEPTILKMLHTPEMQRAGVEGLRNLGTPSAHRALAKLVKDSPPTDVAGPYQTALRYLGEIGDIGDVSVLLEAAHANAPDSDSRKLALESAGEAGGAAAIPALETELLDRSIDTRLDAVSALPLTGSRAAVPVLIRLLQSPEGRISSFAEYGLETLTHLRGTKMDGINSPPPSAYSKWIRWWTTDGQTATIFKPDQCGQIKPIPFP
jgi:HEAT repeat protein